VLLLKPPGVYAPQADTNLLAEVVHGTSLHEGARVLDIGTGTGAIAMAAARAGAREVTAVDISGRAVLAAWLNARVRRLPVRVEHGDVFDRMAGRQFDVILANPPYVPSEGALPRRGASRAWDAGPRGRALLDPLCRQAPQMLAPGGLLVLVHSAVCGVTITLDQLREVGMRAEVVARRTQPFGPVMRGRAAALRAAGLVRPQQQEEELVVIRGERPC